MFGIIHFIAFLIIQCEKLRLAGQYMVWNDMAKKSESVFEKRFNSLTKAESLFCSKLNIYFSKYMFSNVCRKIFLPTFVVLQNSSTSPHPHPSLMKILYLGSSYWPIKRYPVTLSWGWSEQRKDTGETEFPSLV